MENIFTKLTVSLLKLCKACIHAALDGLEEVVDALCDVMNHLVEEFYGIITRQIDVPFFTKLYRLMTQDNLTILNLISYICAVSVSLIYKLQGKTLPYDNEAQVDELVSNLTKRFVWVDNGETDEDNEGIAVTDSSTDGTLQDIATVIGAVYYLFSMVSDGLTLADNLEDSEGYSLLDIAVMSLEVLWFVFSMPFIYSGNTVKAVTLLMWFLFWFGVALDLVFFIANETNIDKIDKGRWASSVYGIAHMICAALALYFDKKNFLSYIPEIFGGASEATKFCLNTGKGKLGYFTLALDSMASISVTVCGSV
jgi:hypothetical protein